MKEVRCTNCNKLLGKFENANGVIKCKCKTVNKIITTIEVLKTHSNNN